MAHVGKYSDLRSTKPLDRLDAAHTLAARALCKRFPDHRVVNVTHLAKAWMPGEVVYYPTRKPQDVKAGAFDIQGPSGRVATVHVGELGKPKIHALQGNKELGNAIAQAFKDDAKYLRSPTVKIVQKLKTIKEHWRLD
ncbi:MAG: hypothetical protein WC792_02670 [Candidatus Micrarchaeia archaeon]|jgi:hypothetical protein